jgi:hypothetical protein
VLNSNPSGLEALLTLQHQRRLDLASTVVVMPTYVDIIWQSGANLAQSFLPHGAAQSGMWEDSSQAVGRPMFQAAAGP